MAKLASMTEDGTKGVLGSYKHPGGTGRVYVASHLDRLLAPGSTSAPGARAVLD